MFPYLMICVVISLRRPAHFISSLNIEGMWQQAKCFERLFEPGMSMRCFKLQGDGKKLIFLEAYISEYAHHLSRELGCACILSCFCLFFHHSEFMIMRRNRCEVLS